MLNCPIRGGRVPLGLVPVIIPKAESLKFPRVVEDVEKFDTKVESKILFNHGVFQHAEIRVVESRTVEESSVRRSETSAVST